MSATWPSPALVHCRNLARAKKRCKISTTWPALGNAGSYLLNDDSGRGAFYRACTACWRAERDCLINDGDETKPCKHRTDGNHRCNANGRREYYLALR